MSLEKSLLAAQGYLELEMPLEALAELDVLPQAERDSELAMQIRLFILMKSQLWEQALHACERMRELYPGAPAGFIHGAFCLHERGQTAEAKALLLEGPESLADEATYFYNLACYSAVLGQLEEALRYVHQSFAMDDKFRDLARLDPDLRAVQDRL